MIYMLDVIEKRTAPESLFLSRISFFLIANCTKKEKVGASWRPVHQPCLSRVSRLPGSPRLLDRFRGLEGSKYFVLG